VCVCWLSKKQINYTQMRATLTNFPPSSCTFPPPFLPPSCATLAAGIAISASVSCVGVQFLSVCGGCSWCVWEGVGGCRCVWEALAHYCLGCLVMLITTNYARVAMRETKSSPHPPLHPSNQRLCQQHLPPVVVALTTPLLSP